MKGLAYGTFLFCLVALANGCASSSTPAAKSSSEEAVYWISMIEAIANPERYDGKRIVLCGFPDIGGPEGEILYLHREDYELGLRKNALGINLSAHPDAKKWGGKYVTVEGTFVAISRNRSFPYAGAMADITLIRLFYTHKPE